MEILDWSGWKHSIWTPLGAIFSLMAILTAILIARWQALHRPVKPKNNLFEKPDNDLFELSVFLYAQGNLEGAEAVCLQAIAKYENTLGLNHSEVGLHIINLAHIYYRQGELLKAEILYRRGLKIHEDAFGPNSIDAGAISGQLASVLRDKGELEESETAYQRALKIHENVFGYSSIKVGEVLLGFGRTLQLKGDYAEAKTAYERAFEILKRDLGPEHPNTKIAKAGYELAIAGQNVVQKLNKLIEG